jgi:hypothetical protein
MAQFPGSIDYKNVSPSGNISAVGKPQTPTGGLEAIARGMEDLKQGFDRVQEQKDASEYSTMKRKFDESANAHLQTYIQTGDPEERKKILQKWNEDVESIRGGSDRVNRQFQMYKDARIPDVGQTFANHELAIQTRQVDDNDKINITAAMKNGDLTEAATIYHNRYKLNRISEAEMNQAITELPNEAVLTQAENAIGNNNGQEALKALSKAKDMTIQQTEKWHKLNAWAKQVGKKTSDEAKVSAIDLMNQNENALGKDKDVISAQIMTNLKDSGVGGDDYLQWAGPGGVIERWKAGKYEQDSPEHASQIDRDIRDASLGQQRRGDVDDYIRKAVSDGYLTPKMASEKLKTNYDDYKKYQNNAIKKFVDESEKILIPKKRASSDMSVDELLSTETSVVNTQDEIDKKNAGYQKLNWVDEQLRDFVKNSPNANESEIYIQYKRILATAQRDVKNYTPEYFVYNDEDYQALPHGVVFKSPDGRIMRKP